MTAVFLPIEYVAAAVSQPLNACIDRILVTVSGCMMTVAFMSYQSRTSIGNSITILRLSDSLVENGKSANMSVSSANILTQAITFLPHIMEH